MKEIGADSQNGNGGEAIALIQNWPVMAAVRDWPQFGMAAWLYALLSLTLVRMLPVAIAASVRASARPA